MKTDFSANLREIIANDGETKKMEDMRIKSEYKCNSCGYEWKPRGKMASRCPRCIKFDVFPLESQVLGAVR
jgi:predicted Zn-ribbon and HTH transcriptional regulator